MNKRVWSGVLVAVLGMVVLAGCSRKPKLDLSGLRTAPGGGDEGAMGPAFSALSGFGSTPGGDAVAGSGFGTGAETAWSSTDTALGGAGGSAIRPIHEPWTEVTIYFAFDSAAIGDSELPKLQRLASDLNRDGNTQYAVIVEGHCDDRGSDEYNRALGENRALIVRDSLISMGVEESRIDTVSYGEERPAVPNAGGESQHALNRRAQFVIGTRQ